MVLPQVVAGLTRQVAELTADHRKETAEEEVGVDGHLGRHLLTQLRYMMVPCILDLYNT